MNGQLPDATGSPEVYDYYFGRSRPGFVTSLVARKQQHQLRLACPDGPPASVLELGPGEGWFARACADAGTGRYLALEASPTGAAALRDRGFDVRVGVAPPLPADIEPVELVYASHFVEHLAGPAEVVELLRACASALAPGGQVVLVYPDAVRIGVDFWDCDYTHRWPSTRRRVCQAAHDAGLVEVRSHQLCLHRSGAAALALRAATRLAPLRTLSRLDRRREDFWFRGAMLFAPDVMTVLRPRLQQARGG